MTSPITRALISVSDKTGIEAFAEGLAQLGIEILSTGGTALMLRQAGLQVIDVSSVTGFPEIMDGRVKTLHPMIHGALLAVTDAPDHLKAMEQHGIEPIGLLVVNLYPFERMVESGADWSVAVENIDVGGPAMIRAAAKNHSRVTVVVDPGDYAAVLAELRSGGGRTLPATRQRLAAKAFARTASYDAAISHWMSSAIGLTMSEGHVVTGGPVLQTLRYGENPHQSAVLCATPGPRYGVTALRQIQGKDLSYNNINDTDAALECLAEFEDSGQAACVIVKHANPCGVALGPTPLEAYRRALACDPVSAFGGVIAINRLLDGATAAEIASLFAEVIAAPDADLDARQRLAEKRNLRLLVLENRPLTGVGLHVRSVGGGLLVQSRDTVSAGDQSSFRIVTKRRPTDGELADMLFAFRVAKHVKSNAIVCARHGMTIGIGAGQMSRVDSARIATTKARGSSDVMDRPLSGFVVASDAFFPFADGLEVVAKAGATAVIQPGGSIRDDDVIKAADEAGLAMIFTGTRHFRH